MDNMNIMAIKKKKSDREDYIDLISRAFVEHTFLCVIIMLIFGLLLIVVGYCIQQTNDTFWAPSFISIGSSLIGIGLVTIVFRAASVRLLEDEMLEKTVKTTLEEMEHTYIPKMLVKCANVSVCVKASNNNYNNPKMEIHEEKTLKNLHEIPIKKRRAEIYLRKDQNFRLTNIKVDIKGKNSDLKVPVKQFHIIPVQCLFSIADNFKDVLNNLNISDDLREKFKTGGFPISENAIVTKEDDEKWVITDERIFIVRKEDEKLNIYSEQPDEKVYMEKYTYDIPFVSSLNKGDEVNITEDYVWSPCKATPNAPNDWDEFAYILDFPTEDLTIKLIAEDNYYFPEITTRVTDVMSGHEISVRSSPVVDEPGKIEKIEWKIPLIDLTHLNSYEIRFRLGIK
jgi:hypothetical protein